MRILGIVAGLAALSLALSGCAGFPRGAGLQSEVLATAEASSDPDLPPVPAEFAIAPVTRATVPFYAAWPAVGETGHPWIERVDQPDNRIIGPGDRLALTVWSTEENGLLTAPGQRFVTLPEMQVSSAGRIFLPYIGEVPVSGMSPETARSRIEERYLEVTPSAQVQLALAGGRQSSASLVSGVAAPGVYPLPDQDMTVLELVAVGGGVSPAVANLNPQIRLQRGDRIYGTSVDRLLAEPQLNTTLVGGDRVYVEPDDRFFLSLGAAGSEARHRFPHDRVTALDALSIIGGIAETRADARGILILRRYPAATVRQGPEGPDHERTIFTIDLTSADGLFSAGQFLIRPDDLVYVTESPLLNTTTVLGLIGRTFGLATQANAVTGL